MGRSALLRAGAGGVSLAFPNSETTGPAAGGYGSLTPVTGASFEIEAGHGTSWPSWVSQPDGEWGPVTVEGIAFGEGTSLFVTAPDVSFIGCSILAAPGTTAAINFADPATTVTSGSAGGEISQVATWSSPSPGVLDVASSTAFPPAGGTVTVATGAGIATVTYTGVSGNSLTGCAYVSGSATGTVSAGGAVTLTDRQLTVRYCRISAQDTVPANRLHICVDGDSCNGSITIDRCDFYWFEQAVHTAAQTLITNSYLHDPVYLGLDHTECVEMPAGSSLTVQNCTLLNPLTQTAVIAGSTSPAPYSVYGSLIGGGGYPFYSYSAAEGMEFAGNWLTTAFWPGGGHAGIFDLPPSWGSNGNVWENNCWYDGPDAGQLVAAP